MKALRDVSARRGEDVEELPPLVGAFLRGLSLGALAGAAIAGSLLLRRRTHTQEDRDEPRRVGPESGST